MQIKASLLPGVLSLCLSISGELFSFNPASCQTIDGALNPSQSNGQNSSCSVLTVEPGPLRDRRVLLLKQIERAKEMSVGVQPYLTAFKQIENLVKIGASVETIEASLKRLNESLKVQISEQKHNGASPTVDKLFNETGPGGLSLQQARDYVLSLVNKERAAHHLPGLSMDSIATAAAQAHADEMAQIGYSGHWDHLGRKPDQRYTEIGGSQNVSENVASHFLFHDNSAPIKLQIVKNHRFTPAQLKKLEADFMEEKPPHDMHRLQTLKPEHNKLGVGISYSENSNGEWFLVIDQEFVDEYGRYSELPKKISRGQAFKVAGSLSPGMNLYSISILCEAEPSPMTRAELMMSPSEYAIPDNVLAEYHPGSSGTAKTWRLKGREEFSVQIVPRLNWKSGLYYVAIAATNTDDIVFISIRTTHL